MSVRASALIVAFNHERYVREAINSALSQSTPPDEVIVIDDGSTDRTASVASSVGDPRVRVIVQPHRGVAGLARTYQDGFLECTGEVVAILEGDDRWPSRKLERQLPHFDRDEVVVSHGHYSVIGANGGLLREGVAPSVALEAGQYDARSFLLRASYIMAVTAVIRRSTVLKIGAFRQLSGTPHWDHPTFLSLAEEGLFFYLPEVLGEWRRHRKSATFRLAGSDLAGIELSRSISLAARERMSGSDLPSPAEISRGWDDAYAEMIWQASRIMLLGKRFGETRSLAWSALRRSVSGPFRAKLALAWLAAVLHFPLERVVRLRTGSSPFRELD